MLGYGYEATIVMDSKLLGFRRSDCGLCEARDGPCGLHLLTGKPVVTEHLRFRSNVPLAKPKEPAQPYPGHPADRASVPGQLRTFQSGATRSMDAEDTRYDLIPPAALESLASTFAEGAVVHGDHNYLKGIPYSVILNHLLRHINLWQRGDASENHLGHAMWGIAALMEFEAEGRGEELDDRYPWN